MRFYDQIKGKIFKIQRGSIHDGPGIRTLVFMKGCPLRCKWCSNPESQAVKDEILLDPDKCRLCKACIKACPIDAIELLNQRINIDRCRCIDCGDCADACVYEAMIFCGKEYSVEEVMAEVRRDVNFYSKSGGGLTISGGEPLFQSTFVSCLMEEAHREGINTALETSGYAEWKQFKTVLLHTDWLFVDMKCYSNDLHKYLTGVHNNLIMQNIKKASKLLKSTNKVMIVRIPIIPSYNDSREELGNIADFLKMETSISGIQLLGYHNLGRNKYKRLDRKYALYNLEAPFRSNLKELEKIFINRGLSIYKSTVIGGN